MAKTLLLSALLLLASPARAAVTWTSLSAATNWELFKTKDTKNAGEVKLYSATIGGTACFKGEASVGGVPADKMLSVATDIEGGMRWSSAGIKDAITLKRSGNTLDYYQYLSVPLISDRFWFLSGTIMRDGNRVGLRWEKAWEGGGPYAKTYQEVVAAHPKAVEPPVNVGAWLFDTAADGTVQVRYLVCTDAGGSIPDNLQQMGTKGTLPTTLDDLVKEARTR